MPGKNGPTMKRLLVGSAALLVVLSTAAMAVDMTPVFKTLPNDSATRDWAGVYGRMSTAQPWNSVTNDGTLHGAPFTSGAASSPDNFIGGGQFGLRCDSNKWHDVSGSAEESRSFASLRMTTV